MLLLLGCIVLLTGCAEDKEINIEEEKQDIVQSGLSDNMDVESIPEENVSEFPEDMFIPDSAKAGLPEVSHFKDKYYFRKREGYSDTESEFFEYRNLPGELIISCDNRETAISCFIYVVEDKGLSECSYAEFTGNIEDSGCVIKYDDDGYGHEGTLIFTFYENGIGVYVDEGGEPNGHGFPTGYNYYMKQELK